MGIVTVVRMPFGMKMPSIEVEVKVPAVEVEIKAPKVPSVSVEIEVKAPKMPAIEVEVPSVDMHAIEAEIRARLEAEAESRIAAAVAAATANMKCKMEQALELAVAEAVAEANRCCDVRCAAEVAAALKGAECKAAPAPAPARIAIPADAIFDAHIDKLMCRARKKFDQFDFDGNGLLDGDELVHLGEWLWSSFHPGEEASEEKKEAEGLKLLFRQDENGDGALSFEEFEGWFRKTCAAIEKYRRGLSKKPNLKVKAPVKQKMPEAKPKPEIMSAAQRIRAAEHAPPAPVSPRMVELSPLSFYAHPMAHLAHMARPAPMGIRANTYESRYAQGFGYSSLPHAHPAHAYHPFEYQRRF